VRLEIRAFRISEGFYFKRVIREKEIEGLVCELFF
jgi:hypothetical protein